MAARDGDAAWARRRRAREPRQLVRRRVEPREADPALGGRRSVGGGLGGADGLPRREERIELGGEPRLVGEGVQLEPPPDGIGGGELGGREAERLDSQLLGRLLADAGEGEHQPLRRTREEGDAFDGDEIALRADVHLGRTHRVEGDVVRRREHVARERVPREQRHRLPAERPLEALAARERRPFGIILRAERSAAARRAGRRRAPRKIDR